MRRDVHGEADPKVDFEHRACPDVYCCECECRQCKRDWIAKGKPTPDDCPQHGGLKDARDAQLRDEAHRLFEEIEHRFRIVAAGDTFTPREREIVRAIVVVLCEHFK